jgi:hypothetical protein
MALRRRLSTGLPFHFTITFFEGDYELDSLSCQGHKVVNKSTRISFWPFGIAGSASSPYFSI